MHSPSPQRQRPVLSGPASPTEFAMAFTSTPHDARLARLFVAQCLDSWGHPYGSDANETLTLITAELCANAVQHGRVPGRVFHVRPAAEADGRRLRLEVSDTRAGRRPVAIIPTDPDVESESGRCLLLVVALADAWGITGRGSGPSPGPGPGPGPGKTVWAVLNTASSRRRSLCTKPTASPGPAASWLSSPAATRTAPETSASANSSAPACSPSTASRCGG
ncbi:ATP-binding protein [Streptomyces massasporeus]|uniref:ATP-binding protein n=1 Tax=Streptomyces massasporeus TaxID=67324 RepID=UPI001998FE05|nr:ATP-binding protein [Streptomyces massasporeus]GGV60077.1 hypothetical protein GCM10010228_07660 [Streptomyces massasporeus]